MQLKSIIFGTNFFYFLIEYVLFIILIAKIMPIRLFTIQRKILRGIFWLIWNLIFSIIFIYHEHYVGNPIESPGFYLNMELFALIGGIIVNLIHNSGHDKTILKQKVRNIIF